MGSSKDIVWLGHITDADFFREVKSLSPSHAKRESARAIIRRGDKICLMYSTVQQFYMLPGGGIEEGEDYEAALVREILEETGYTVHIVSYIGSVEEQENEANNGVGLQHISHGYLVDYVGKDSSSLALTEQEESLGFIAQWYTVEEALHCVSTNKERIAAQGLDPYGYDFVSARELCYLTRFSQMIV